MHLLGFLAASHHKFIQVKNTFLQIFCIHLLHEINTIIRMNYLQKSARGRTIKNKLLCVPRKWKDSSVYFVVQLVVLYSICCKQSYCQRQSQASQKWTQTRQQHTTLKSVRHVSDKLKKGFHFFKQQKFVFIQENKHPQMFFCEIQS